MNMNIWGPVHYVVGGDVVICSGACGRRQVRQKEPRRASRTAGSLALLAALLSGCASEKAWMYGAEPAAHTAPVVEKSVSVPAFDDRRVNENSNNWGLYLIPLMPFGPQTLNTPEGVNRHATSTQWQWRPNEDIAKATAQEFNSAGLFREVFFSNRASEGDWVLHGTINSTKYDGKILSYGLSAYGPMLWFLGLPAASVSNELDVTFALEDQKTKRTLWQKEYKEKMSAMSWIYSVKADFEYAALLKKILLQATKDMKADLAKKRDAADTATIE